MYKIQASLKGKEDWFDLDLSPFTSHAEAEYWLEMHEYNDVRKIYDYKIVEIE